MEEWCEGESGYINPLLSRRPVPQFMHALAGKVFGFWPFCRDPKVQIEGLVSTPTRRIPCSENSPERGSDSRLEPITSYNQASPPRAAHHHPNPPFLTGHVTERDDRRCRRRRSSKVPSRLRKQSVERESSTLGAVCGAYKMACKRPNEQ